MRCAWQAFVNLLPVWMRESVDKHGKETLQELRLRLDLPPELVKTTGSVWLEKKVTIDDIRFCVNIASKYSPWSMWTTSHGYITAQGGHRIGLCGEAVINNGIMGGIGSPTSLCIRVARDFSDIARNAVNYKGSVLIIGRPGSGKTTLLRDLIRVKSNTLQGSIAVVDEKGEIFPRSQNKFCFPPGKKTDILTGCKKAHGIDVVLRNMGPEIIAVDEITAPEDCEAMLHAGWCGVKLIATAHADSCKDLLTRPIYQPIVKSRLFDTVLVLRPDKSWHAERIDI